MSSWSRLVSEIDALIFTIQNRNITELDGARQYLYLFPQGIIMVCAFMHTNYVLEKSVSYILA